MITDGGAGDMSGVELCFDSGVDINCEEEQIERTVQVDVGLVLDGLKEFLKSFVKS